MRVEIVLGTRPEIIKMAPVVRRCKEKNISLRIAHTGQHYDENLSNQFFLDLDLPEPGINFNIGSGTHAEQTGRALIALERDFIYWKPDVVLAEGDTNAVLSAALASVKLLVPFGHVEAGIRSFDRTMPEEINRILADQCADFCFAPTDVAEKNLLNEGIRKEIIFLTGNTIVDACMENIKRAQKKSDILSKLRLSGSYIVATFHRVNNTDDLNRLSEITQALNEIGITVVFPVHPRTLNKITTNKLKLNSNVICTEPLGYLDFLKLLHNARAVITDSGGIQEEASILQVPCVTVRDSTERPETVKVGVNILVKAEKEQILETSRRIIQDNAVWKSMRGKENLYGDGKASHRIINILLEHFEV